MLELKELTASGLRHDLGGILAALRTARELGDPKSDTSELLDLAIQRMERLVAALKRELSPKGAE